jgi:hypothetical protein
MHNELNISNKHYTFSSKNKKYIFNTKKKFGVELSFSKEKIDFIVNLYSKFTGNNTSSEIASKLGISAEIVKHILRVMRITHDSVPYTEEVMESVDEDLLVEQTLIDKKNSIIQKIESRDQKETRDDAEKWRAFKTLHINPFEEFLNKWKLSANIPVKTLFKNPQKNDRELLIGCSDWHYGLIASESTLYNQKEWNIDKTVKVVEEYGRKLVTHLKENSYKKVNVCFLGDIAHSITGETDKGTKLHAYPLGQEQLDIAFSSLVHFVQMLLTVHDNIHLYSVNGNHDSVSDYILMKMLSIFFKNDKRIKFTLTNKRHQMFKIYNNLFMISHGYAPFTRDRLPPPGKAREAYINNLFMAKTGQHGVVGNKYFISGDLHHFESYEYTNIEGYIFPTIAGGCEYSDHSGYKSRQRQCCLSVDKTGVTQIIHFYLD